MVTITIKFDEISQIVHSRGYPTIEVNVITADGVLHRADVLSGASTEPFEGREGLVEETITIKSIKASPVIDIFGIPTVEVDVITSDGLLFRAAVPSHASTGLYEALELRDGELDYLKKGVSKAVENVNAIIAPALIGKDPTDQVQIDNLMVQQLDRTSSKWGWCKHKFGADAILAVSVAICTAGAAVNSIPLYKHIANLSSNKTLVLPVPAFNVINGGLHAENKLAMQKFMILPTGANSFYEAIMMGVKVYHNLKDVIKENYGLYATNVDVEGLFALNFQENKEGVELLKRAIAKAGYTGKFIIEMDDSIVEEIGEQVQIVGDDLFGTNHAVNQVRTVTEGIEATKMSKSVEWGLMVSHGSGEIQDAFIADLSVGLATGLIKTGPPIHSESIGKYNQFVRIEEELGPAASYAGANFKAPQNIF